MLRGVGQRPVLAVLVGAFAIAFSGIVFRLSHASASTAAFYRCVWALPPLWMLARLEDRAYQSVPAPDLVIYLDVPVELACHRNLTRDKAGGPKPTGYVRRRHALASELDFPGVRVHRVDATADLARTMRSVNRIVWNAL